ncbi:hypothetical protein H9Y04_30745 [Streptomyces sp. TRM66268-LWL]|uniref:Uncharacterized protein n=1 Tax=Streptomyces polyasparticus TaxID=2767826 RepID=A0ABR7SQG6_9ACTN|nr:hypothetical protein [Streptomyces polyasparticus]MBC9716920.1 hypothetical protein [Streptomyces polyasparticus]
MDELRRELRAAAERHDPDKARMWARIERGMSADTVVTGRSPRPQTRGWLRVAGAAAGVAGVVAVAGISATAAMRDDNPGPSAVTSAPQPGTPTADSTATVQGTASPDPSRKPSSSPPSGEDAKTSETPDPDPGRKTSPPPATSAAGETDGPLWSDGSVNPHSNDFWAQSDVTVKTTEPLTSLVVELKIARTEGVASTGEWRTRPAEDFVSDVVETDGFLIYRWTLQPGKTVPAGSHVFAGQYNHEEGGRNAYGDSYSARATANGEEARVEGNFARHED